VFGGDLGALSVSTRAQSSFSCKLNQTRKNAEFEKKINGVYLLTIFTAASDALAMGAATFQQVQQRVAVGTRERP